MLDESAIEMDTEFDVHLKNARLGDGRELGSLLNAFRPLLRQIAERQLGQRIQVRISGSDLVQETLLAATQNFRAFRGSSPHQLQSWLKRILRARLNDGLRRHLYAERRRMGAQDVGPVSEQHAGTLTPSKLAMLNEQSDVLLRAISELDEADRRVLTLRYMEQLGFEAIAQKMELPLSTVWRRWRRAVEQLKIRLENAGC